MIKLEIPKSIWTYLTPINNKKNNEEIEGNFFNLKKSIYQNI